MTTEPAGRPAALVLAAALSAVAAVFLLAMAGASLSAGGGSLGRGVAAFLALWGLIVGWVSIALFRGRPWARGPVVAAALIHVASMVSFATSQPWAWLGAVVALATVVAAVWPSTTHALHLDRS
ncbi:hypothetical protein [Nigerium massiliense]|uniref:hypothetical protein n=1 Tax=Nigerium massiliense TaxID=1522317 RepID=UPI00059007A1|nr:hypothetical protein [Nigerium massiliense]